MKKSRIVKILIVLFLVSLFVPSKGFAYDLYHRKDDDVSDYYEYDEPDDWSYREDWDDDLDDYWGDPESADKDDVETIFGIAIVGMVFVVIIIAGVISLAFKIVEIIGLWKIFTKSGEQGFASIIPIYSDYIKIKIGRSAWWWLLIQYGAAIVGVLGSVFTAGLSYIIAIASIIARVSINYNLCKKFHKDMGYAILMTFFPYIGFPMLGFNKDAKFDSSVVTSEYGIFESMVNTSKETTSSTYCPNCGEKNDCSVKFCKNCGNKLNN